MKNIEALIRPNILALEPYSTARDDFKGEASVFIDANENPWNNGYNRYPDPRQRRLKDAVANLENIKVENLFLGNGSDEAIDVLMRIFCRPGVDNIIVQAPSYGMYKVSAAINDIEVRPVLLDDDFGLDVEDVFSRVDENTRIIMLCSPNNPTGRSVPIEDIRLIAERFDGIVVVDEAYIHFSEEPSAITLIDDLENLVVLRTLSKARGLAGMRVGMAVASPLIVDYMSRVKYPYNISQATIDKALEFIGSNTDYDRQIAVIIEERKKLKDRLSGLKSVEKIYPSDANFLLVKVDDANRMYDYLAERGIVVRNRTTQPRCHNCLRITIGTPEENEQLVKTLLSYEKETADN